MRPVKVFKFTIGANQPYRLPCNGSSFKILEASGKVEVKGDWGMIDQCQVGQGITGQEFAYLVLTDQSGAANTVRLIVGDAGFIDNITGTVGVTASVMPAYGSQISTGATVTTTAAQVLAANPARKYLAIQNNSGAGNVFFGYGPGMSLTNSLKIAPGGNFEPAAVPTNAVWLLGDIASNPNVVVVEGY